MDLGVRNPVGLFPAQAFSVLQKSPSNSQVILECLGAHIEKISLGYIISSDCCALPLHFNLHFSELPELSWEELSGGTPSW